ncbi:MAG: transposase [Gammaproteobacteria bacterium]|jgi:putative transposase|nr:transposase [Gammaproteobacteria bacterium]
MKKSKLNSNEIVTMLAEVEAGVALTELCRKYHISSPTYSKLKNKYSGINVPELKRLKELEAENRCLKVMYADISLEHKILKEVIEKKYPELIDDC